MANRPVISIAVDDAAFDRFLENFNAYTAKVDDMAMPWQALERAMGSATGEMKEGAAVAAASLTGAAAATAAVSKEFQNATKAQTEFGGPAGTSHKQLQGLAKTASGLGK